MVSGGSNGTAPATVSLNTKETTEGITNNYIMHSYYLLLGTCYSCYQKEKYKTRFKTAIIVYTRATA